MTGVKDFLESSTIHGLTYISSSTNKLQKIFWVVVVVGCFLTAGFLISNSFSDWQEDPVSTTVQTFPISTVPFPR